MDALLWTGVRGGGAVATLADTSVMNVSDSRAVDGAADQARGKV
ncbi:MAG: hypothetical protein NTX31_01050 [Burkholderiales bacterium]|nr:hypothetical protein [Burkholderiales bacterium]